MTQIFIESLSFLPSVPNDFNDLERPIFPYLVTTRFFAAALSPHLLMKSHLCTRRNTELLMKSDTKKFTIRLNLSQLYPCPPTLLGPLLRNCNRLIKLEMAGGDNNNKNSNNLSSMMSTSEHNVQDEHLLLISNQIPTLECLSLPNCRSLTDEGILYLIKFRYLRELTLNRASEKRITKDGLNAIFADKRSRLKRTLRKLDVAECAMFSKRCLASLCLLSREEIDDDNNELSCDSPSTRISYFRESKIEHLNINSCHALFKNDDLVNDQNSTAVSVSSTKKGIYSAYDEKQEHPLHFASIIAHLALNSLTYLDAGNTKISEKHFRKIIQESERKENLFKCRTSPLRTLKLDVTFVLETTSWLPSHFLFVNELTLSQHDSLHNASAPVPIIGGGRNRTRAAMLAQFLANPGGGVNNANNNNNTNNANNNNLQNNDSRNVVDLKGIAGLDLIHEVKFWGECFEDKSFVELVDTVEKDREESLLMKRKRSSYYRGDDDTDEGNHTTTTLADFSIESSLQSLSLIGCPEITDETLAAIGNLHLPNLRSLCLQSCRRLSAKGISQLFLSHASSLTSTSSSSLTKLQLTMTGGLRGAQQNPLVTDESFQIITSSLPMLEELSILGSPLTQVGFQTLSRLSKSLKKLEIALCKNLNDECMTVFSENCFENLEHINASVCRWMSDDGLRHVVKIPNLMSLELSDCEDFITDSGFAILGECCRKLTRLSCSRNMLLTDKSLRLLLDDNEPKEEKKMKKFFPSLTYLEMMNCFAFSQSLKGEVSEHLLKKGIEVAL